MPGDTESTGGCFHRPVLVRETVSALLPAEGKIFLDGTVGGGGHSLALLEAGACVIACDQDPQALQEASKKLAGYSNRVRFVESNFADLADWLPEIGVKELDGIVLDLGVSSHQLDTPSRGFSFLGNGPLDMRMGAHIQRTAADLVNQSSQEELARIFFEFGEEPAGRRLAAHLVKARGRAPILTTSDLVKAVESVIPKRGPRHPATRVFQALRIAVNDELAVLERALRGLSVRVKGGGRIAVIAFHSLEDRIVKRFFREVSQEWIDRPEWPEPQRNPAYGFRLMTARPIEPSEEEIRQNSRARSAKLRVIERIGNES
ncbi:MAG: 16S rRNA (cytosine(1402)-N(4))-methyltransferase RsmH [Verrucomicrobia bacterium]|nr:16S rRNA (cytosine(1402)-N(4))-methyltransferase RsmH [Verrucomicrobiota bacterium]MBV8378927.1 16S rRNA (cytosine(1402)-N(4))-methyltransferase RsmH [Verrucomicrobiota bacterium]